VDGAPISVPRQPRAKARKGRGVAAALRYPGFRRAFRAITVAWGVGYLAEAAIRVAIVATTSTGIALICSKLVPYAFAIVLSGWTLVYGEHEKRKAEHLASTATGTAGPYTLVRCLAP
jgi:hypothetical protein